MKTTLIISSRLTAVALATAALVGCRSDATSPPPQAHGVSAAPSTSVAAVVVPAESPPPVVVVPAAANPVPVPAAATAAPQETAPESPALSPGVAEVVQMARAQVGEQVLLDYVQDSPVAYDMTSAEIVYLKDVGISEPVIQAMMHRGQALRAQAPAAPAVETVPVSSEPPAVAPAEAVTVMAPVPASPVYETPVAAPAAAPASVTNNYFYGSLSPYGSWVEVADYGWCWRPTCGVVDTGWRPYYDNGCWVYSDSGWYWNSYYSWGWAPFHYGRWHMNPRWGWVWSPGHVWGPAWVTWRYTDGYCGWAPLPPACGWSTGVGLTWHGSGVSVGFSFGLTAGSYCFVPYRSFCHPHPHRYGVGPHEVDGIYRNSTVVNNVIIGNNNTIINGGVAPERFPTDSRQEIRRVALRDVAPGRSPRLNPGQVDERRGEVAVYRPKVPPQLSRPTKGDNHYDPPYHATSRTASWEAPRSASPSTRTLTAAPARSDPATPRSVASPAAASVAPSRSTAGTTPRTGTSAVAPTRRELVTPQPQRTPSRTVSAPVVTRSVTDRGGMRLMPSRSSPSTSPQGYEPSSSFTTPRTSVTAPSRSSVTTSTPSTTRPVAPLQVMPGRSISPASPTLPSRVTPGVAAPTRSPASGSTSLRIGPTQSDRIMTAPSRSSGGLSSPYSRGTVSSPSVSSGSALRSTAPSVRSVPSASVPTAPSRSSSVSRPMTPSSPRMSAPTMRGSSAPSAPARSATPSVRPNSTRRQ
ncbi:MAG: hypothetical protein H7A46_05910 [Verrucomicrobiales bacterium]|nr:hypothetical protein [Verrucomicrobiales bacterium]